VTVAAIDAPKSAKEKHATREVLSTTRQIEPARAHARKEWVGDERHLYRDEARTGAEFVKRQPFTRLFAAVGAAEPPPSTSSSSGSGSASGGICFGARARGTTEVGRGRGDGTP